MTCLGLFVYTGELLVVSFYNCANLSLLLLQFVTANCKILPHVKKKNSAQNQVRNTSALSELRMPGPQLQGLYFILLPLIWRREIFKTYSAFCSSNPVTGNGEVHCLVLRKKRENWFLVLCSFSQLLNCKKPVSCVKTCYKELGRGGLPCVHLNRKHECTGDVVLALPDFL